MQPVTYLTALLLVVSAVASAASPSQPEQASNSPSVEPAQSQASVVVEAAHQQQQQPQHVVAGGEHHQQVLHQSAPAVSYYAPAAGMITVVGDQQQQGAKPAAHAHSAQQVARAYEQYGQPESAALPANYKPFGSWGLYIGGNPADGYYTNYYKALSNSVADKQPVVGGEQQLGSARPAGVGPAAAPSPALRQAGVSPFPGADYYPFAYSPGELSPAARVDVPPMAGAAPPLSPVQAGAQVYGSPAAFESNGYPSAYADAYATKKVGAAYAQKEVGAPPKGYQQSRVYVYPSVGQLAAPSVAGQVHAGQGVHQAHQQSQVVAYPVPIGSQIVGSQAGVDGAFAPYGVHAFTRYAVKPTVVSQADSGYYYGVHQPATFGYRQQVYQPAGASYYPLSYYGYPLNQLHYSQGSVFPVSSVQGGEPHHVAMQPQMDGVVGFDKFENDDKNKQQKRA